MFFLGSVSAYCKNGSGLKREQNLASFFEFLIAVPSKLINALLWLVFPDEICLTQQQHLVNGVKGTK